jgi:hypothetical protein
MAAPTTPFTFQHTPQLPEILAELGCSLVVSTYQAGKVIMIRSDGERLIQLPRTFEEPMGLAVDGDRMAVATRLHRDARERAAPRASYPRASPRSTTRSSCRALCTTAARWQCTTWSSPSTAARRQHALLVPLPARPALQLPAGLEAAFVSRSRPRTAAI